MRKLIKFLTSRTFTLLIAFLVQIGIYAGLFFAFRDYFVYYYIFEIVVRILAIIYILNDQTASAYKVAWLILIVFAPYLGSVCYLLFAGGSTSKFFKRKFNFIAKSANSVLKKDETSSASFAEINKKSPEFEGLCRYLNRYGCFPVYRNETADFYPTGEEYFSALVAELKKAQKFIFMEYFILQEGKMWNTILDILKEKAKSGVEVKVLYDDLGCFFNLPRNYPEELKKYGIECRVFNPIRAILSLIYNNRDHRKICVIDGKTAFTGGINLADEYINEVERFGHWKDYGVKFTGEAVWNFTAAFLSVWEFCSDREKVNYAAYKAENKRAENYNGYIIPFTDSPFDGEIVSENVYIDIIDKATKYIYITTPYLILDSRMTGALTTASKRGVDVRIMTPHIPDKKVVFQVTRSNYTQLVKSGVRIFEYTPGFMHAKSIIADDKIAVVGSINLDYRSLYLHCENGVLMYEIPDIKKIKADHIKTMKISEEITSTKTNVFVRVLRSVLNVFAPLM